LKHLGLGARIFAAGNMSLYPGEVLPMTNQAGSTTTAVQYFQSLHRELASPSILVCPEDKSASTTQAWNVLGSRNVSYFANLTARELQPGGFLYGDGNLRSGTNRVTGSFTVHSNTPLSWTAERHRSQGNIALADGSVQSFNDGFLQRHLLRSGMSSNILVFP
jgi:prepilin-type processing-associated H-X9-DG protein